MVFFCHVLLARVPPRCVSLCRSPEMIFHGHPWLLKVVRPGSPLNEEPRPTLLYYHYWSIIFLIFLLAASLLSRLTKGNWDFRRGGRCYQPNAVIAWRIPAEHTTGFRRLICDDHRNDNTNCDYDNTNNCKEIFIALEIVHHECPNFIHCEKKVVISWLILVSAHPQSVSK